MLKILVKKIEVPENVITDERIFVFDKRLSH